MNSVRKNKRSKRADDTFHDYRGWLFSEKLARRVDWFGLPERDALSIFEAFPPTIAYTRFDPKLAPFEIPTDLKPTFVRMTPWGNELIDVRWSIKKPSDEAVSELRDAARAAGFQDFLVWTEGALRYGDLVNNAEMVIFGARNPADQELETDIIATLAQNGGTATLAAVAERLGIGWSKQYPAVCRLLQGNKIQLCEPATLLGPTSRVRIFEPTRQDQDPLAAALAAGHLRSSRVAAEKAAFQAATKQSEPVFAGLSEADRAEVERRLFYIRNSEELISRYGWLGRYKHSPNNRKYSPGGGNRPDNSASDGRLVGYPRCARVLTRLLRFQLARQSKAADRRARKGRPEDKLPPYVFGPVDAPSGSTIKTWRDKYRKGGIMGLKPGRRENYFPSIQDPRVIAVLRKHANAYRQVEKPDLAKIIGDIEADLFRLNKSGERLPVPGREAIESFIADAYSAKELAEGREGKKVARQRFRHRREAPRPTRPFQIVEIDETPLDAVLVAVDEQGAIIGTFRPFFVAAIDKATRNVLAFWLGPEKPTAAIVARTLRRAMLPKRVDDVAGATPIDLVGLVETLVIDNGSAFRARELMTALGELRIRPQICKKGAGDLKGTIEGLFRTYQTILAVPGRTFSNPQEKRDYDAEAAACLTLDDAAWIIKRWIVDIHHNQAPELPPGVMTPAAMARELKDRTCTPHIDPYRLAALLLREEKATITSRGVRHDSLFYGSQELTKIHESEGEGYEITVTPDDDDLTYLVAIVPKGPRLFLEKRSQEDVEGLTREELHDRRWAAKARSGEAEGYEARMEATLAINSRVESAKLKRKGNGKGKASAASEHGALPQLAELSGTFNTDGWLEPAIPDDEAPPDPPPEADPDQSENEPPQPRKKRMPWA